MRKYFLYIAFLFLLVSAISFGIETYWFSKLCVVCGLISFAIGIGSVKALANYQYTFWIVTAVVSGLIYPKEILNVGGIDLRNKWLILIIVQLVMFGMGTQMSIKDFIGIKKSGRGVLVGLLCQFTIMPVIGFLIAKAFQFEPEIAAGIVLIGSCSSGLASNVMTYIAKGDLVLSVTVTAISTLTAPIMTTFLMKVFAGTFIEIDFLTMMMNIVKIVLVPLIAAMIHDALKIYNSKTRAFIFKISMICGLWLLLVLFLSETIFGKTMPNVIIIINFLCAAFVVGVLYHMVYKSFCKIDSYMPLFSMFGIVYFTLVTTAAGSENLLEIGLLLFLAAILHNSAGYVFGYAISRIGGLSKKQSQTIAFEVGLQNGGMASGLAGAMGKLATLGLAAAVFSPWMNISGSVLANFWRKRN
ncbi:bile acid:sodium symporter [Tamlana nanhaiensis]|uniref:Bile acid:sodium symporter n=1 Tax=Neotamlana nanhaiensis TaxID=1382798 RepID=A0A0D7W987_9FLAO|nr:bile acid:sodium symporter family protein [Tamlana nanhaiensis]KJD34342.1 bile acid:sodium symporter [Tamlana nanhaiensis]